MINNLWFQFKLIVKNYLHFIKWKFKTMNRTEKVIQAYNFLLEKESNNDAFFLRDLSKAIGWKESTVKTYLSKQWKKFIIKDKGKYICSGLTALSQNDFIKLNSQTIKFSPKIYNEREDLIVKARQFSLLAISVYNNPYSEFKTYGYIVNIIIAWTALFHAIFQKNNIEYFYKNKNNLPEYVDGDLKAWELSKCIDEYWKNENPIKLNLKLLIGLRNKIEHRNIPMLDLEIAGHC